MRIVVENLACRRSGRLVFEGVSFTLARGEVLIVTGRNGAGKSSLLALMAGRLRADEGAIRAEAVGESRLSECLHFVAHRDALKGALTAAENLAFARDILGTPALSPGEALEQVGLAHAAMIPVAYLSAGQRRRVALARLLVAHRPLWLLDEPTSALDLAAQETLLRLITGHLAGGGLLVAATHAALAIEGSKELRLGKEIPTPLRGGGGGGVANPERDERNRSTADMETSGSGENPSGAGSPGGTTPTPTPPRKGERKDAS